jgi:hypothetical protein
MAHPPREKTKALTPGVDAGSAVLIETKRRGRGRPRKKVTDRFRSIAWYYAVAARVGTTSGYALERHFAIRGSKAITGSWRKYRQGRRPQRALIERVERRYPGTCCWFDLPLWELIEELGPSQSRLFQILSSLPEAARYMVLSYKLSLLHEPALTQMHAGHDIESMTGCLGVMRLAQLRLTEPTLRETEARYWSTVARVSACAALYVLAHLAIVERPFAALYAELHAHINARFNTSRYGESGLSVEIRCLRATASTLQTLGILEPSPSAWRAFLRVVHDINDLSVGPLARVANGLARLCGQLRRGRLSAPASMKKLALQLRAVQMPPSCLDQSLCSYALRQPRLGSASRVDEP